MYTICIYSHNLLEKDQEVHSAKKKREVVTKVVIYGNVRRAAEETGVDVETIWDWQKEQWWRDMEQEVRSGIRGDLMSKMHGIVDRALGILEDRLEHGDVVLNVKTGEIVRRPVAARDVQRIATEVLGKKISLEKEIDKTQVRQETVQEMLGALAKGFLEFNKKTKQQLQPVEVVDVEVKEITNAKQITEAGQDDGRSGT